MGFDTPNVYQDGATPLGGDDTDYEDDGFIDYSEMAEDSVFLGDMTYSAIMDGIKEQFTDYINTEDTTNYVEIFYDQWNNSVEVIQDDDSEEHPQEVMDALNNIKSRFVSELFELFESRLTITIMAVDDELTEEDEVEVVIRQLYEYFILGARDNFKAVISKGIIQHIGLIPGDTGYNERIDDLLRDYDPLVRCITPTEFIQYTGRLDIVALFDDGQIAGNFLRKYSAKLYQNDEFKVDVINHISTMQNVKEDITNAE